LKNRASRRDPALCGYCKCSHRTEYAALFKMPHALADGLMLVFEHPDRPILAELVRTAQQDKRAGGSLVQGVGYDFNRGLKNCDCGRDPAFCS